MVGGGDNMKLRAVIIAVAVAVVGAAYFMFFASGDRNSSGVDGIVNDGSSIAVDNSIGDNYPKASKSDLHSPEVGKKGLGLYCGLLIHYRQFFYWIRIPILNNLHRFRIITIILVTYSYSCRT